MISFWVNVVKLD